MSAKKATFYLFTKAKLLDIFFIYTKTKYQRLKNLRLEFCVGEKARKKEKDRDLVPSFSSIVLQLNCPPLPGEVYIFIKKTVNYWLVSLM